MTIESHLHGGKLEVMGDIPGCLVNPAHGLDQRLRVVLRPWDQIQQAFHKLFLSTTTLGSVRNSGGCRPLEIRLHRVSRSGRWFQSPGTKPGHSINLCAGFKWPSLFSVPKRKRSFSQPWLLITPVQDTQSRDTRPASPWSTCGRTSWWPGTLLD